MNRTLLPASRVPARARRRILTRFWISALISCVGGRRSVFFFQAEDGIRDWSVTGVQTCALPISRARVEAALDHGDVEQRLGQAVALERLLEQRAKPAGAAKPVRHDEAALRIVLEIGRASCRERV